MQKATGLCNITTPKAGGPYAITISDTKPVTLTNVMIGEVWLCSGQSNMEMPVKGFKNQPIIGAEQTILESNNSKYPTLPGGTDTLAIGARE